MRKQADLEIEEALKQNKNCKIVFVTSFQQEYTIQYGDIASINAVCNAIKAKLEYGIIFNKVSKTALKAISELAYTDFLKGLSLDKNPSATIMLANESDLEDEDTLYFKSDSENRKKLLNFLDTLPANRIAANK